MVRVIEKMKKAGINSLRDEKWEIEEDLVLKEKKVYILKDEELRTKVIRLYYDVPVAEHEGRWKIMELVMRNYWWPGVIRDIGRYINNCNICQRIKN